MYYVFVIEVEFGYYKEMRQVNTSDNCDNDDDVRATISKIRELEHLYTQAKHDAMKLRRKLEGKCIVLTAGNRPQSKHCECGGDENANSRLAAVTQDPPQQPQKRGRGRPRKVKDSLELIRGDIDDQIDDGGTPRVNNYNCNCNCNSEKNSMNNVYDEFINAVYSIENEELYVKTQIGKFYDINTMQLRGWFNSYLKMNVWIE